MNQHHPMERKAGGELLFTVLLIALLIFGTGSTLLEAQPLPTLQHLAAENNPGLKAEYKEFEAAMERVAQAGSLQNPSLSMGYFLSPVETRVGPQQVRLSLTQMLPWFGTLRMKEEKEARLAEAAFADFQEARNRIFLSVAMAYYPLLEVEEQLTIQQNNIELLQGYKNITTRKFENSAGTMADVLKTELILQRLKTTLDILQDRKRNLLVTFNRLLDRPDDTPVHPVEQDTLLTGPVNDLTDSLVWDNPRLVAQTLRSSATATGESLARQSKKPTFGIGIDYIFIGQRETEGMPLTDNGKNALMPMLTISLPVFGQRYSAEVKEARLEKEASILRESQVRNELVSALADARFEYARASRLLSLYEKQVELTQRTLNLQFSAYSNDREKFQEVVDLQQQLLDYETIRAKTRTDLLLAEARINYLRSNYIEK